MERIRDATPPDLTVERHLQAHVARKGGLYCKMIVCQFAQINLLLHVSAVFITVNHHLEYAVG